MKIDDCINEQVANHRSHEQSTQHEKENPIAKTDTVITSLQQNMSDLEKKNAELGNNLVKERERIQKLLESDHQNESRIQQLLQQIDKVEKQQKQIEKEKDRLREVMQKIRSIDYPNIQPIVVQTFLAPKHSNILDLIKQATPNLDASIRDTIPKMIFRAHNDQYIVEIVGLTEHHQQFKAILQRIWSLLNVTESAKNFYRRHLKRMIIDLERNKLRKVRCKSTIWHQYIDIFLQLVKNKQTQYENRFDDAIKQQILVMVDGCVDGQISKPWIDIRKFSDKFMADHPFEKEIDQVKQAAVDEFININILDQRTIVEKPPSQASVDVLQKYISAVKKELKENRIYHGTLVENFEPLPKLLLRLILYHGAFKTQLPLFESSQDLLDKIQRNTVTTIATSTGSGKRDEGYTTLNSDDHVIDF